MLQDQFLDILAKEMFSEGKDNDESRLFPLRYHPQHFDKKNKDRRHPGNTNTIVAEYQKLYSVALSNINQSIQRLIDNYFLPTFQDEMINDGINSEVLKQTPQEKYLDTYHWLWEQKFPREAWNLAKQIATPVKDELTMISKTDRMITKNIPKEAALQKEQEYRIKLDLPDDGYLLLINEDAEGNQFLITPSKAFGEIPTPLSQPLFLPPDDKINRGFIAFETERELFLGIVTPQPIALSWMDEHYRNEDVNLDQQRLEEIFLKVGKLANCKLFKRQFLVN